MPRGMFSDSEFAGLPSVSVAAHELKTPITLMRQLSLLLQDDTLSDAQRERYQGQLIATADQALRLTTNLAQVANLQPSLFPLEPVNPLAICRSVVEEMRPVAELHGRAVAWPKSRRKTLLAVANRQLLRSVIMNFLDNALKYTEENAPVEVKTYQRDGFVRIDVRDYGPQIARQEYRRLLNEMERRKMVRTRPDSSGIGIFIASQFAKTMQGSIGLTRHRDGVTFYVELPLSQQMSWL